MLNTGKRLLPPFAHRWIKALRRRRMQAQLAPLQSRLNAILQQYNTARPIIIFAPGLDWHKHIFQRPQHLASALAKQGALVFYLQPDPQPGDEPFQAIQPNLYVCHTPVELFWSLQKPFVYLLTWNRDYAASFNRPRIIYDYLDDLEVMEDHNPARLQQEHKQLLRRASLVLTTATRLYDKVKPLRQDMLLCPNGVTLEHFAPGKISTGQPPPVDLQAVMATGRPVIGYYGALARWFDYELLGWLLQNRPDLSFLLIGPDYDKTLPAALLEYPNLFWLDAKPYAELPRYLAYFDAAIIPFRVNQITHATSPLKLFEYMAAGKPVVITPMQESLRYPGVLAAEGPQAFSQQIDRALQLKDDPQYLSQIATVAQENTWEARARQILAALEIR